MSRNATASWKGYDYQKIYAIKLLLENASLNKSIQLEGDEGEDVNIIYNDNTNNTAENTIDANNNIDNMKIDAYQLKYYNSLTGKIYFTKYKQDKKNITNVMFAQHNNDKINKLYFIVGSDKNKEKQTMLGEKECLFIELINKTKYEYANNIFVMSYLDIFEKDFITDGNYKKYIDDNTFMYNIMNNVKDVFIRKLKNKKNTVEKLKTQYKKSNNLINMVTHKYILEILETDSENLYNNAINLKYDDINIKFDNKIKEKIEKVIKDKINMLYIEEIDNIINNAKKKKTIEEITQFCDDKMKKCDNNSIEHELCAKIKELCEKYNDTDVLNKKLDKIDVNIYINYSLNTKNNKEKAFLEFLINENKYLPFYAKFEFKIGETYDELNKYIQEQIKSYPSFGEFIGRTWEMDKLYQEFQTDVLYGFLLKEITNILFKYNKNIKIDDLLEELGNKTKIYKSDKDIIKLYFNGLEHLTKKYSSINPSVNINYDDIIKIISNYDCNEIQYMDIVKILNISSLSNNGRLFINNLVSLYQLILGDNINDNQKIKIIFEDQGFINFISEYYKYSYHCWETIDNKLVKKKKPNPFIHYLISGKKYNTLAKFGEQYATYFKNKYTIST